MIVTQEVEYKGRLLQYDEIKNGSQLPITVRCDSCGRLFQTTKRQIVRNKHEYCQKCALRLKQSITLPIGEKYGRLEVIGYTQNALTIFRCDCGNVIERKATDVKNGYTKSCGCLQRDNAKRIAREVLIHYQHGEEHPNWQGGTSYERSRFEATKAYKAWKMAVLSKGKCEKCGSSERLIPHHIRNYASYPELRTDVTNGACLCQSCHRKLHSRYGLKNTTVEQYREFLLKGEQDEDSD